MCHNKEDQLHFSVKVNFFSTIKDFSGFAALTMSNQRYINDVSTLFESCHQMSSSFTNLFFSYKPR